jgi:uncharacterized PurR-regulated membrane protein YhhQ (DUF165 family)
MRFQTILIKYKWSPLNIAAHLFLGWCILYTAINYSRLSEGEGWGVVAMVGLTGVGLSALAIDFLMRRYIVSKQIRIIMSSVVLLIYIVTLVSSGGLF